MEQKNQKKAEDPEHLSNEENFKNMKARKPGTFTLEFSLLAVRNMVGKAKDPVVSVWLSDDVEKKNVKEFTVTDETNYNVFPRAG